MTDALDETVDGGPRPRRTLEAGAQLGKYTLERVLGAGGMGVVWCARDPDLERSVAIKLLLSADAGAEQRARLLREARAMARLKHPNVLTVYEVDTDADRDFIAMELVEGTTIDAWLDAGPPASEVWDAVMAAGRGLAAAHAAGLVHRDFKPHNVLRSRDGRVLVTDFGLARGLGEVATAPAPATAPVAVTPAIATGLDATIEATPAAPIGKPVSQSASRRSDKILDSTLTQPGALIGTPAYMAPEQFTGAAPDPRTDQFAFCVTAWQALTGKRPFAGESIDELRKSASAGVANVPARLPRAVRAVLARGLAVDPAARWPDLDALLDALERAHELPRRRRAIGFAVFGIAAAAVLFVTMRHRDTAPAASGCDATFDPWTPARRAAFEKRLDHHANAIVIADAFDEFRAAWLKRYHDACVAGAGSGANGAKHEARINCLLGERDDLDGLARLTDTVPKTAIAGFDLWGLLPSLEACDGNSPVAPPLLPEERKARDQIVGIRAQIAAARLDPAKLLEREDALVAAAKKLGWKPMLAELAVAFGAAAQFTGNLESARTHFESAAEAAVSLADFKVEAAARIGLLEVELDATGDPSDPKRLDTLIDRASDAVQRAGNDPALSSAVEILHARADAELGELDKAIDRFEHVRDRLLRGRGLRVAAVSAAQEIDALIQRGNATDLDTAKRIGEQTERAVEASKRPISRRALDAALADLAWRRGDLTDVHARADRWLIEHRFGQTVAVAGKVVGPDGAPVAGAIVITWEGDLDGDATRAFTGQYTGEAATTDTNGAFTISAMKGGSLAAEHGTQRSTPVAATEHVTLALAETHAFTGKITTASRAVLDVIARSAPAHGSAWNVRAPVARDGTYALRGVPPGATVALATTDKSSSHVVRGLAWPDGPTLDVIVRLPGHERDDFDVTVLRGRRPVTSLADATTRASDPDVAHASPIPIGLANATREGRAKYQRTDRHAVVRDNAPGDVTACALVANEQEPVPPCVTGTLPAGHGTVVLVLTR